MPVSASPPSSRAASSTLPPSPARPTRSSPKRPSSSSRACQALRLQRRQQTGQQIVPVKPHKETVRPHGPVETQQRRDLAAPAGRRHRHRDIGLGREVRQAGVTVRQDRVANAVAQHRPNPETVPRRPLRIGVNADEIRLDPRLALLVKVERAVAGVEHDAGQRVVPRTKLQTHLTGKHVLLCRDGRIQPCPRPSSGCRGPTTSGNPPPDRAHPPRRHPPAKAGSCFGTAPPATSLQPTPRRRARHDVAAPDAWRLRSGTKPGLSGSSGFRQASPSIRPTARASCARQP